ncbi:MAG: TolC family protein [Planctomycetota bacterium]|nr:TolC family protein [Planctomycetota bacterium]
MRRFGCWQASFSLVLSLGAVTAVSCRYGTECCIEQRVSLLGSEPVDLSPARVPVASAEPAAAPLPAPRSARPIPAEDRDKPAPQQLREQSVVPPQESRSEMRRLPNAADSKERERQDSVTRSDRFAVQQVAFAGVEKPPEPLAPPARFAIPKALPGADSPPLRLPSFDPNRPSAERQSFVEAMFKPLPELPASTVMPHEPGKTALTLTELQQLAYENSPKLRQAAADVDTARGQSIQAGLYPNPVAGFEQDTVGSGGTAGQYGGFVSQEFVTAKKLQLARNAALMDVQTAELTLRRARIELASDVRQGYFDVLVAQERVKFARALAQFSEEVYRAQIELVAGGEAAPYEPLQLRVFAMQTRNAVRRAENGYLSAWRQLAANMGVPGLPPAELAGSVNAAVPRVSYEAALNFLLTHHTNLAIAQAQIEKAQYHLRLQRVTPIPNVNVQTVLQRDTTALPNNITYNLQVGVPLPIFNNNRGNVVSGEAQLVGAQQTLTDTRNTLTASLADVFNRYASNAAIAEAYRTDIISDQVRTYRGIHDRFRQAGDNVDFAQLVVAQQTLGQVVNDYLNALSDQWQAVVDLAQVLQIDDLFQLEPLVGKGPEQ